MITNDQWTIKAAQVNLTQAEATNDTAGINTMTLYIANTQKDLDNQTNKLKALLATNEYSGFATYDIPGQTYDRLTVEDAMMKELAVQSAQQTLDKSRILSISHKKVLI